MIYDDCITVSMGYIEAQTVDILLLQVTDSFWQTENNCPRITCKKLPQACHVLLNAISKLMQFHFLSLIAPLRFLFCLINLDVEQVTNVMLRIRGTRSPSRARRYQ